MICDKHVDHRGVRHCLLWCGDLDRIFIAIVL
jgi:hypothetical protein